MVELLMIADDFTGALDSGVQFAARGAVTRVVTTPAYDFCSVDPETQVLVLDAETRHLTAQAAYDIVFQAVQNAIRAGIPYIYKKTDSGLRGNIGSELTAVLDAAGANRMEFLPAFPKMDRITRDGVHYINGTPVAESMFGQDPFEPVRCSDLTGIIRAQSQKPVVLCQTAGDDLPGIHVYDAATDDDLRRIGAQLGREGLRLSGGCAGFAAVLADILDLNGPAPQLPQLPENFFVMCGSVNPVTLKQMEVAEGDGFPHIHLTPAQKLEASWSGTAACEEAVTEWLALTETRGCCILDVNDPAGCDDTVRYAADHRLAREDLRVRISNNLAVLVQKLLDGGLDATLLCTGGDTLLALMHQVGVAELTPVREVEPGAVLTHFTYRGKTYHIISKSGGFGASDLLCKLASKVRSR